MGSLARKSWNTGHPKISAPFLTRILEREVRQLHASSLNTHLLSAPFYSCRYTDFQCVSMPVARGDHSRSIPKRFSMPSCTYFAFLVEAWRGLRLYWNPH